MVVAGPHGRGLEVDGLLAYLSNTPAPDTQAHHFNTMKPAMFNSSLHSICITFSGWPAARHARARILSALRIIYRVRAYGTTVIVEEDIESVFLHRADIAVEKMATPGTQKNQHQYPDSVPQSFAADLCVLYACGRPQPHPLFQHLQPLRHRKLAR